MRRIIPVILWLMAMAVSAAPAPDSTTAPDTSRHGFVMKKSPTDAILYSLAFPGLGQMYNETYWKAPLFAAGAGACIYGIISNQSSFAERDAAAASAVAAGKTQSEITLIRRQREFYRDQRDLSGFFLIVTYLAATVDAYSDAHLYDFDVGDKLSLRLMPDASHNGIMLALSW